MAAGALGLCLAGLVAALVSEARPFVLASLSRRLGRPVHVEGELSLHPRLTSLTVRFTRLHVDSAAWARPTALVRVDRGAVTLPWSALLGDVRLEDVDLDGVRIALERDARGRVSWSDGDSRPSPRLPRIARVAVRDARLDYLDRGRALSFQGAITVTQPSVGGPPLLTVRGGGRSEGDLWRLDARSTTDFTGATPYVLSGRLVLDRTDGRSSVGFAGRFTPSAPGRFQGRLEGTGPDLHDLSHLINAPLPHTPPYRLRTQVDHTAAATRLQGAGEVGASDVSGVLTITPRPGERHVDGDLRSRALRMSDLFAVASGGQLTRPHRKSGQLLPDTAINPVPLRKLDGTIRLAAASVQAPTTPTIRSLALRATFDHGRLAAEPMMLNLAHGRATVRFVLDVRGPTPRLRLDAELHGADTSDFRRAERPAPPLQAAFDGDIHLRGQGPSLLAATSHAFGDIRLRALDGRLQQPQAAVLSGHLIGGAVALLGRSHEEVPVQCAVVRFQVSDGEARATRVHMVTGLGGTVGFGGFDLASGALDMSLQPADRSGAGASSVRLRGTIAHPRPTLALAGPIGLAGRALAGLLQIGRPPSPSSSRCD